MTLSDAWYGSSDAPVNRLIIPSMRSVRVIARMTMPKQKPRGLVITTHGSAAEPEFPDELEPWLKRGLATLRLRVRGYPPSTLDIGDLRDEWIMHCIESRDGWILRGAVADVVQAFRCARRKLGADMPIMLHGESLGGGLAVIAAAVLESLGDPPARIAIGLPTFGDWRWRRGKYCSGSGRLVNKLHERLRLASDELLMTLELFDAAFHARGVRSAVLCKLACLDDVVPAPSAAAVFNALPGLPGEQKWRYVVRYGHFDGGIADARRHAVFERLHPVFLEPTVDPGTAVQDVELNLSDVHAAPA